MAVTATFTRTAKRRNSTLRPSGGSSFACLLKEPCDVYRPTFQLAYSGLPNWNYATFNGNYYWVTNVTSVHNDFIEVSCELDPLATYRTEILASTQFIQYAATGYNIDLADPRLAYSDKPTRVDRAGYAFHDKFSTSGTYIMSAVGLGSGAATWALTPNQLNQLCNSLNNFVIGAIPDSSGATSDIVAAVKQLCETVCQIGRNVVGYGNALDNIRSCVWVPFANINTGPSGNIYLGQYNTGVSANQVVRARTDVFIQNVSFTIDGDWRDYAPFKIFRLYLPFVGIVTLPNAPVINAGGTVNLTVSITPATGEMSFLVYAGQEEIGTYGAKCSQPVPIGVSNIDAGAMIQNGIVAVLGAAAGNPLMAGQAAANLVNAFMSPVMDCVGGIGSASAVGLGVAVFAFTEIHTPVDIDGQSPDVMGRPVMEAQTIGSHSGYVQTRAASVEAPGNAATLNAINAALDGGCFIE